MTRDEVLKLAGKSQAFCMAPWVHLYVPASGPVTACCEAKGDFGTIEGSGFEGVWNGEAMRAFRAGLMADQKTPLCWKCYEMEERGALSYRQRFNAEYARHADRVAKTQADGRLEGAPPISWDLRFSNLCNLRCRMCWHGSSSRWFEDAKALGQTVGPNALIRSVDDPRRFLEEISDQLPHLEKVYFAGGEPLLMEEHYLILEALLARGLTRVQIIYSTNLTQLAFRDRSVLDLWKRFEDVTVVVSADGTEARGELIRKELDWKQFLANLRRVRESCPHVRVGSAVAVSVFNVQHLPELHRALVEEGQIAPHYVFMHALQEPACYSVSVLTDELKSAARDRLAAHREWLDAWYAKNGDAFQAERAGLLAQLGSISTFLGTPADAQQQQRFRELTAQLDSLRGENLQAVFPELASLFAVGS